MQFIHRRTRLLAIITLCLMAVFVIRLFQLQVIKHTYYASVAQSEQTKKWVVPAVRGEIYAMDDGTPRKIVLNQTVYKVWVDPSVIVDGGSVMDVLKQVAGGNLVDDAEDLIKKTTTQYQVVATNVTYTQAIAIKAKGLYGVGFESGTKRIYPEGQLASQVLGFVNAGGDGQYGIEGYLNDELKGADGLLKTVTDVRDVPLTIGKDNVSIPAKDGRDVVLSIDENIQAEAERALPQQMAKIGATKGSLLVMNPNNGQVLAMANYPTYDPNKLSGVKDISLLNNPIITNAYEPASVMKTVAFSTVIDQGKMSANSTYENTGQIQVQDRTINNASKPAYLMGKITMQTALNWSFNTGAVTAAQWLGGGSINYNARKILYQYYHDRFHLGERSGIELQGESAGIVISPDDPSGEGNAVRYANMTFGQGLDVTTLQMAAAFSAEINGGVYHKPTVVAGEVNSDGRFVAAKSSAGARAIKETTSDQIREMIHVARLQFGYDSADPKGYYIGGKTGTAQTIENGQYTFNQQTGTYIGFGGTPGQKPAYVVMAYVAKPNTQLGGQDAMVVFNPMSNWMIKYLKLAPKG